MIVGLICAGFAATVFLLATMLLGNRSDVSRRVAELEGTATLQTPDRPMPVVRHLLSSVDKNAIAAKLVEAGWFKTSVTTFVFSRVICFAVLAAIAGFFVLLFHQTSPLAIAIALGVAAFGLTLPSFALDRAIAQRKLALGNRLPDFLDMVSTTVEAGVALNSALAIATSSMKGPLAEEMEMVLSDIRLGRNRADAFNAMAQRVHQVDLSSVVMAIVQTERLGGNIGNVLDELAVEARARRLQRAEELAASLPVKMVIPMAFFMLPALFVMIFTPVAAQLIGHQ